MSSLRRVPPPRYIRAYNKASDATPTAATPEARSRVLEALQDSTDARGEDLRYFREVVIPAWEESGSVADLEQHKMKAVADFSRDRSEVKRRRVGQWMQALEVARNTLRGKRQTA